MNHRDLVKVNNLNSKSKKDIVEWTKLCIHVTTALLMVKFFELEHSYIEIFCIPLFIPAVYVYYIIMEKYFDK